MSWEDVQKGYFNRSINNDAQMEGYARRNAEDRERADREAERERQRLADLERIARVGTPNTGDTNGRRGIQVGSSAPASFESSARGFGVLGAMIGLIYFVMQSPALAWEAALYPVGIGLVAGAFAGVLLHALLVVISKVLSVLFALAGAVFLLYLALFIIGGGLKPF